MAGPAYVQTAAGPVYTRGEQAFLRDRSGKIVTVAAGDAGRLLDESQDYLPVSAEDVAHRDVEIARSTLPEQVKTVAESAGATALGLAAAPVRLAKRGLGALGVEGAGKEADELGGRKLLSDVVKTFTSPQDVGSYDSSAYDKAARERSEVNPNAETVGTVLGSAPFMLAGPGAAAGAATRGLGVAGRIAGQVAGGAAEGALYGEAQATDDAYIQDKPLTAEKLMASMGWGALIGGGASLGFSALGEGAGALKRRVTGGAGREVVSDEAAAAFTQSKREAQTAAAVDPTDARISAAADSGGLNPAARQEAARAEASQLVTEAKAADPTDWRAFTKQASPEAQYLHRGTVLDAASTETARDLTNVLDRQAPIYNEIDNLQVKRDRIAEHLAADGVDETAVIGRAQEEAAALRSRIAEQRAQVRARQAELAPAGDVGQQVDAQGLINTKYGRDGMRDMTGIRKAYAGASKKEAQAIALGEAPPVGSVSKQPLPPVDVAVYPEGVSLVDGRHRMTAAREAGARKIAARIRTYDGQGNIIAEELRPVSIEAAPGAATKPKMSSAEKALQEMDTIVRDHEAKILAADAGADAVASYDSMRRQLSKVWRTARATRGQTYAERTLMEPIADFARVEYDGAARALMDEGFVGKTQAAAQKAVNNARVGSINGERFDLRPFVQQVGSEEGAEFGGRVMVGNQDSIRGMLEGLGQGGTSMRADQFARFVDSQETTLKAIKDNYALSPAAASKLDESLASLTKMRGSVDAATDAANAVNRAKARIEADQIGGGFLAKLAASTAVGGVEGGVSGAAKGFARGLLGGAGPTLELQQRLATLASSEESRLAAWLEDKISKVSGTAGKGAAVVNQTAGNVDGKIGTALDGFFKRITQGARVAGTVARETLSYAKAATTPTALRLFSDGDRPPDAYRKRTEELLAMNRDLGAGVRDRTTAAMGGIAETAPRLTQHVAVAASRGVSYLLAHTPVPLRAPSVISPGYRPVPSDLEISQFAKRWAAVADPLTVLDDFQKGMVTYEQVDALKNVYPTLYQSIRVEALQRFQQLDAANVPVPYADRLQADLMFDLQGAGEPTLDPGFALKVSGMMQAAKQRNSQPAPGRKPLQIAKSMTSESQAIGATLRGVSQ